MAFLSFLKKKGEECVYVPSMGTGRQQELELKQNIVDVFRLEFPPQARRDCRAANRERALCAICSCASLRQVYYLGAWLMTHASLPCRVARPRGPKTTPWGPGAENTHGGKPGTVALFKIQMHGLGI